MVIQGLVYSGVQFYLPLPIAVTLTRTGPLFVTIFDRIINKVHINNRQIFWLIIAFIGVGLTANGSYLLAVIDPELINNATDFKHYISNDPLTLTYAGITMVLTMALHSFGVVSTKRLKSGSTFHINFIQGLLIFETSAILMPFVLKNT